MRLGVVMANCVGIAQVAKFAFDHENKAKLLRSMGIIVNGGSVLTDLLLKAYNTPGLAPVPLCLQTAPPQGLAKLLMGVDITDREFYFNDYNNPLLSERYRKRTLCTAASKLSISLCTAHLHHIHLWLAIGISWVTCLLFCPKRVWLNLSTHSHKLHLSNSRVS